MNFNKILNSIGVNRYRYEVFRDFVSLSAISIHNGVKMDENLEQEYLEIVAKYSKEDVIGFSHLLGELIILSDDEPKDVLGQLFMSLELGNKHTGQFFTPDCVNQLISSVIYGKQIEIPACGFTTLSEPACGAGGMVLGFVNQLISQNINPATSFFAHCTDIDRNVALMCYLQLSLWNVPAQIIVGNSLTLETREVLYTPAYYLYGWSLKLREHFAKPENHLKKVETIKLDNNIKIGNIEDVVQLDMFG